jgi:hypothetical protein
MALFTPNPSAEANAAFDVVRPGVYRMRVKEIRDTKDDGSLFISEKGNKYYKSILEYVDPSALLKEDGTPVKNAGNLFDILVYEPAEHQGRLRNFVEACGKAWGEVSDTDDLIGCEVDVKVKVDTYEGEKSNKVARYLPVK